MRSTATTVTALARDNISDSVAAEVRRRIVDGRLPAGERINEVHLSQELGVSRTPLREALGRLAAEGALTNVPRFGYFVRALTLEELEQIYDIRPLLDPEALRLAGVPTPKRMERLEKLNRRLAAARSPEAAIELDDAWHRELLAECPNRVLVELIENIILRTRRYELALMRETSNVLRATEDHSRILAALRAGNIGGACAALRHNMQSGRAPIVSWLRARESRPGA
jgi:DNA-binding GntR family transcriptional regulator